MGTEYARSARTRAWTMVVVSMTVAVCLACFTSDGRAAEKKKGTIVRIQAALESYSNEFFAPQTGSGSTEAGQENAFLGINARLVGLNLYPPTSPSDSIALPGPGLPPTVGTVSQRAIAQLEFGPGSEPFAIDSFFDITYRIANSGSSLLGPFDTEMLAMTLTGNNAVLGTVMLRESPTLASTGQHTIALSADQNFAYVQSFFDVFTELSINGGPFVPTNDSFRVGYIPEPTSTVIVSMAIGCVSLCGRRRRRER